ncbi:MAG: 1-acyl-sn-glycerol-3-phosphate acyltransferase, partial [Gammaproteobacteria bacterium]|nr:1-acyl-sn-glycerol-3-phosphate acyltransferase [Gammaproteobacteria bacterium]
MIRTVAQNIYGSMTMLLFVLNVFLWAIPIMVISLFKFLIPTPAWQLMASRWLMKCGENWISFNRGIVGLTQDIHWDFRGVEGLRRQEWYLVVSNHQSWLDILALQLALNRRIPFLKFFIKQQLIWIPILGQVWWAMDMPFMKRYSREYL